MTTKAMPNEMLDWLEAQQRALAAGTLSADKAAFLNEHAPGWDDEDIESQRTANWLESLDVGYTTEDGLASLWLRKRIDALEAGTLPDESRTALDAAIPGWGQALDA